MSSNSSLLISELSFSQDSLEALRSMRRQPGYKVYLTEVIPYLRSGPVMTLETDSDPVGIYRAQGQLHMLNQVQQLLTDILSWEEGNDGAKH